MANLVLSTKYLRGSRTKGAGNLLQYMATREGVEKIDINTDRRPSTKRQDDLIRKAKSQFPEVYFYPEFNSYLEARTRANADELLAAIVDRNADCVPDMNALVHYYAERPGVEKLGSHGLFSDTDDDIDLDKVAEEVSQIHGIVFTDVISLRREDASRLGYDNAEAWKGCIRRNLNEIAEAHKINMSELKWYAAFYNTAHHPHVHLMVYSEHGNGYITKKGYLDLKKAFVNDIFRNEQYKLFKLQSDIRQELKDKYREILIHLANTEVSDNMLGQFVELAKDLQNCDGKKVYGYLPKSVKEKVDNLVKQIAKVPEIAELYSEWNRLNREKLSVYYDSSKDEDIPLEENKEFRSLKNQLISFVLKLDTSQNNSNQRFTDNTNKVIVGDALSLFAYAMNISSSKRIDSLNGQLDIELMKRQMEKREALGLKGMPENTKKETDEEASETAAGNVAAAIGIGAAIIDTVVHKTNEEKPVEEEPEDKEIHYYDDGTFSIGDSKTLWYIDGEDENGNPIIKYGGEMEDEDEDEAEEDSFGMIM